MSEQPDYHMLNQYENEANLEAHVRTTGPEIWRQTGGNITHFVAGLVTCGTITGNGRFLKSRNPDVKVIGVHPAEEHDIPGVRSLKQLQQTTLFFPDEYDAVVEIDNRSAYEMSLRLTREESLIAGPSSAMALLGALKVIEDEPEAVVVVIFPDNIFKYASSVARHFPEFRSAPDASNDGAGPSPKEQFLNELVENSRNTHNPLECGGLKARLDNSEPVLLIDVRDAKTYAKQHVTGAVNIPVPGLAVRRAELPESLEAPIVTICNKGNLSISGMLVLQSMGYRNVQSLNGGTLKWAKEGLPTA